MKIEKRYFPVNKTKFVCNYIRDKILEIPCTVTLCFNIHTGELFSVVEGIVDEKEALRIQCNTYPVYDGDEYIGYVNAYIFCCKGRV